MSTISAAAGAETPMPQVLFRNLVGNDLVFLGPAAPGTAEPGEGHDSGDTSSARSVARASVASVMITRVCS